MTTTTILVVLVIVATVSAIPSAARRRSPPNPHPEVVLRDPLITAETFPVVEENDYSYRCGHFRHPHMGLRKLHGQAAAKCNDGSSAGYYLLRQPKSDRWVIYLQGGWYCSDRESCNMREREDPRLVSSRQWPSCEMGKGILSTRERSNPHLFESNMVFVPYCSSDLWSGTISNQSLGNKTFHFMGATIVAQVVKALLGRHGMRSATHVLLTGSSAGGTGVLLNIDAVQSILRAAGSDVQVRGVADSSWYLLRPNMLHDASCSDPSICSSVTLITKGVSAWHPRLPAKCRATQIEGEQWKCFFGHVTFPHIEAPVFVMQWKFDTLQLQLDDVNLLAYPANVSKLFHYMKKLSSEIRSSLENVDAVFAPSCVGHTVLIHSDWSSTTVSETNLPDAIQCWESSLDSKRKKRDLHKYNAPSDGDEDSLNLIETGSINATDLLEDDNDDYWYGNYIYVNDMPVPACTYKAIDMCCTPQCNPTCPDIYHPHSVNPLTENDLWEYYGINRLTVLRSSFESLQDMLRALCYN